MYIEIWKTVENFSDYQVNNHGRVKSLKFKKEKILNKYNFRLLEMEKHGNI